MASPQLLDYIRKNIAAGFARPDIEKALLSAGWQAQDIAEGFHAIEYPEAVVTPAPMPVPIASTPLRATEVRGPLEPSVVRDDAAEAARIQHELDLAQKRQVWRGDSTATDPGSGGIIGWLIRKGIVKNESQANIILVGVAVAAMAVAVGIFMWGGSGGGSGPVGPTPQEIQAMQHLPMPANNK